MEYFQHIYNHEKDNIHHISNNIQVISIYHIANMGKYGKQSCIPKELVLHLAKIGELQCRNLTQHSWMKMVADMRQNTQLLNM